MNHTQEEVMQFVQEQDVRFVKLSFCDIFGELKNINISSKELERAFNSGISFDASAIRGFLNIDESDLFLFPDASTLSILPWRPSQGRVIRLYCSIKRPDGSPFEGDVRTLLRDTATEAALAGYAMTIGPECEFYLFKRDENGIPTHEPLDQGTYFDAAPFDKGENIRREICLTLEQMGFYTERSHHESGPGQNEVDFKYGTPLEAADNMITFKNVVRTLAERAGLFASFLPKPIKNISGSGLHVNISLAERNEELQSYMIGGILSHINEITLFTNPLINSYERLGAWEAPQHIGWGHANRSLLVRIPQANGNYRRLEVRSPDPSCNPYLCFTLLVRAALDGIKKKTMPPEEQHYTDGQLPANLGEAIGQAASSAFVAGCLPSRLLSCFLEAKRADWQRYVSAEDKEAASRLPYFLTT
ncbi:MAG: glutamine synthetase family protein [Sphaerochaeta sp.]|jgi:glutamine synthetase|nr:glutamine synthetase family protein [Sphaerochaeta sp.]MCI2045303.1 glutamine synthetase family protein [Sphaerochaeta sp.]MCI2097655.1 glutamine synthetase family protein [Sphaerochaeta sp.]MCI2104755.1 glutamine synthetase family protein [Sphaerochaeta sp.]MCI2129193.1 glutamine synthetase family protein [Sphaerochaeta sp.]